jgi:hypothetical protein
LVGGGGGPPPPPRHSMKTTSMCTLEVEVSRDEYFFKNTIQVLISTFSNMRRKPFSRHCIPVLKILLVRRGTEPLLTEEGYFS